MENIKNICTQTGIKCGVPCHDKCPVYKQLDLFTPGGVKILSKQDIEKSKMLRKYT